MKCELSPSLPAFVRQLTTNQTHRLFWTHDSLQSNIIGVKFLQSLKQAMSVK